MTIRPEDEAEAEQLKLVTLADRRLILDGQRAIADNPRVPAEERREAKRRFEALSKLLRMKPRRKS